MQLHGTEPQRAQRREFSQGVRVLDAMNVQREIVQGGKALELRRIEPGAKAMHAKSYLRVYFDERGEYIQIDGGEPGAVLDTSAMLHGL
jgi:hypothetical protein